MKNDDLVTQVKGKYRGEPAKVAFVWDATDSDGYREMLIFVKYLNLEIHKILKQLFCLD